MKKWKTIVWALLGLALAPAARAAAPALVVKFHPGNVSVTENSGNYSVDMAQMFGFNGTTGTVVQLNTTLGNMYLELFDSVAPQTVANFVRYINDGAYTFGVVQRSDPGSVTPGSNSGFVIQGGATLIYNGTLTLVPTHNAIPNEYSLPNVRGTIAMAKQGGNVDSATSQWFINTGNNTDSLGASNNGGFTVFGQVLGDGMTVVDAIAALPSFDFSGAYGGSFQQMPLSNYTMADYTNSTVPKLQNLVLYSAGVVPYLGVATVPTNKLDIAASGTKVFFKPKANATGTVVITFSGEDGAGGRVTTSINFNIGVPQISTQPKASVTVKKGANLTLTAKAVGAATLKYQWLKGGVAVKNTKGSIAGATTASLALTKVQTKAAGKYTLKVTNGFGTATSKAATVIVK